MSDIQYERRKVLSFYEGPWIPCPEPSPEDKARMLRIAQTDNWKLGDFEYRAFTAISGIRVVISSAEVELNQLRQRISELQAALTATTRKPVYLFRRRGLRDFCTCDLARYTELAQKASFEVRIVYDHTDKE